MTTDLTQSEQEALLTLTLMAAFADGGKSDLERAEVKRIAQGLPSGDLNLTALYQRVLLRQTTVGHVVASLTTVDMQLSYSPTNPESVLLRDVTVRFGINNLFDRRPPFVDGPANLGFDARNFPPQSRMIYVRLAKSFGGTSR